MQKEDQHLKKIVSFCGLTILLILAAVASIRIRAGSKGTMVTTSITNTADNTVIRPLALIYRGPAGCRGCSEAAATLLQNSKWNFEIQYVGPDERLQISDAVLKTAILYVQPGGDGTVKTAYSLLRSEAETIRNFVKAGGRYLGFCMGAYIAGSTPGFKLLPGDTDQFIASSKASVRTEADTIVKVNWRGKVRHMYFQDGPYFKLHRGAQDVTVLAEYTNSKIAVLVAPYGKGKVGVSGPHPEATANWYKMYNLTNPDGLTEDLGQDLLDTLME